VPTIPILAFSGVGGEVYLLGSGGTKNSIKTSKTEKRPFDKDSQNKPSQKSHSIANVIISDTG